MSDTIAAAATGAVRSAIGVIRVSGDGAVASAASVFRPKGYASLASAPAGRLVYGELLGRGGETIDLCLAVVFRAPRSYTGEDSAEIQCHGSPAVMAEALSALFAAGARQAGPGEFTKRAFLNGKLDLTEAEAVADIVDAGTAAAAANAAGQLSGAIAEKTSGIYAKLLDMAAHFHAVVDWPDEDIPDFRAAEYAAMLDAAAAELSALLATFDRGRVLRDGALCAIVGRPNAGKSSLLNALVGFDRAIVTASPGTTRDTVEEKAVLGGALIRLTDTAGLRDAGDEAEREGVRRAESAARDADLVIGVFDGSAPAAPEDLRTLEALMNAPRAVAVINKSDLPLRLGPADMPAFSPLASVSAKSGAGIAELASLIGGMFASGDAPRGELLTNARQADEVKRALGAVRSASEGIKSGVTPDAVLEDAEEAAAALGALSGRNLRPDITDRIFSRFCVGK